MDKKLSGKGYIRGGEGHFLTSTGDLYHYHDGVLTPETKPDRKPQEAIETSYQGMFEPQPSHDHRQPSYGKAFVER